MSSPRTASFRFRSWYEEDRPEDRQHLRRTDSPVARVCIQQDELWALVSFFMELLEYLGFGAVVVDL